MDLNAWGRLVIYRVSGAGIREKLPENLALTFGTGRDAHSALKFKPAAQAPGKINIIQHLKSKERESGQNIA